MAFHLIFLKAIIPMPSSPTSFGRSAGAGVQASVLIQSSATLNNEINKSDFGIDVPHV